MVTRRSRRPAILAVDDDPAVGRAIERDLRHRYGDRHRVLLAESGAAALGLLERLVRRGDEVALFVADQRMPEMTGVEFLARAIALAPAAKRTLLTAYADTDAAIRAINEVGLDHYLMKPWSPPEEHLYPVLDDLLEDWAAGRAAQAEPVLRLVGDRYSAEAHRVRDFVVRNGIPYRWLDGDDPEGARLMAAAGAGPADLPLLVFADGEALARPSQSDIAAKVGLSVTASLPFYDLVILGGGPAGLAAAVYGASEGLRTLLIERHATGGQAGQSSRIENYLGFPSGLSGADLARRATAQARRLGAEMLTAREVRGLRADGPARVVVLDDGEEVACHAVLVATGVHYRRLEVPGLDELHGAGVYYGAAPAEAAAVAGEDVVVVGAANSAGQAVVDLAGKARSVTVVCRADGLGVSMSHYLVDRISGLSNVHVIPRSAVEAAEGDGRLEGLTINVRGERRRLPAAAAFIFIGARPQTDWLEGVVARDPAGYIRSGVTVARLEGRHRWPLARDPLPLETSMPGVFVAGDVRDQSIKRVASAVGEGSMAVSLVHQYLAAAAPPVGAS